ncbi:restriction endonuclease subunit S domain-containing protein [Hymenobacter daeguensis]
MNYPVYVKTTKTGLPWVPVVPAHWEIKRLRFLAEGIEQGWSPQCNNHPAEGDEWGVLKVGCVNGNAFNPQENKQLPAELEPRTEYQIQLGDILISRANTRELLGSAGIVDKLTTKLLLCDKLYRLRVNDTIDKRFLVNYLRSKAARAHYECEATGTSGSMQNIGQDTIANLQVPLPPLDEQHAIVAFLDEQTARLDALLARQHRLLRLLAEKRTALITQAVTQGLDAAAPRRPSGVAWLSEMPAHWEVKRLKYILTESLKYGANEVAEFEDPDHPRFVRITDVKPNGKLKDETFKSLPPEIAEPYLLKEGDILLARSGATVGKNFKYEKSWGTAAFAGYLIRARLDKSVMADFVSLFLSSHIYWEWIKSIFIQATIQNVSAEKYAYLQIPIPPLAEQAKIMESIRPVLKRIDKTIALAEKAVKRFQEYRAALITAAVTGQIDVRAAVTAEAA